MNKMSELYELTKKFNTISGAINETSSSAFIEQYNYIREEFEELTASLGGEYSYSNNCLTLKEHKTEQVLDDCLDIIITVFGFLQKLEKLGVDVNGAAIATANNNLEKYTTIPTVAHETVERKAQDGVQCVATFNPEYQVYVIRNKASGKIVKPYNFVSNSLMEFVPEGIFVEQDKLKAGV